jgi:hypothetical protein
VSAQDVETVQVEIDRDVLVRFRAAVEKRGVSWRRAWREAAAAWADMDDAELERREAWLELGEGLFSGPTDSADRHDDYIYGQR